MYVLTYALPIRRGYRMHSPPCLIGRGYSVHALVWCVTFVLGRSATHMLLYVYFYLVACDALASYCAGDIFGG